MKIQDYSQPAGRSIISKSLLLSACAGFGTAMGVFAYVQLNRDHLRFDPAFYYEVSHGVIIDVPRSLRLGSAIPAVDTFAAIQSKKRVLPNLNSQAQSFLADLGGNWSDGTLYLSIDASRFRGQLGHNITAPLNPITVRDLNPKMITLDVGPQRYIIVRREQGIGIGGSNLISPIEMKRVD